MKKKIVILTGAGFTKLWDAPTTDKITKSVLEINDPLIKSVKEILEKQNPNFNFEDIVDEVENIYQYFHQRGQFENYLVPDSIFTFPLNPKVVDLYNKKIDSDASYLSASSLIHQEVESVYYKIIIDKIIDTVKTYVRSFRSFQCANQNLLDFFNFFSDYAIRYYTLNYDELVNGFLHAFNGFDLRENGKEYYRVNPQGIIKKSDENCNFNLHGSIHYFAEQVQVGHMHWPKLVRYDDYDHTPDLRYIPSGKDQDKKPLLLSPIITGFNKPSRVLFEPLSYFFHAFQSDCFQADIIMTIGYSFSDIHINQWIQSALNLGKCRFVRLDHTKGNVKYISEEILLPDDYKVNDLSKQTNGLFYNEQKKGYFYWKGIEDFVQDKEAWELIKK